MSALGDLFHSKLPTSLEIDDVDINITNGNIPTFKFKIEVNLSSLVDFKPRFENVEIAGK